MLARRRWFLHGLAALLVLLALGCNLLPSDREHDVLLHNTLDEPIVVDDGVSDRPAEWPRLAAGQTLRVGWLIDALLEHPDQPLHRVAAFDAAGRLVFCRRYSDATLEAIEWRIEIGDGVLACSRIVMVMVG